MSPGRLAAVLALAVAMHPAASQTPTPFQTGADVVRAVHARWSPRRDSTLTFVQQTVVHRPGAPPDTATWAEALAPGRLRIDVLPLSDRTAYFWTRGVRTVVQNGAVVDRRPDVNVLAVVLSDVYSQPPDRTLAVLDSLGYDTAALGESRLDGRAVWVVGSADTTANAVWIDRERLVPVRVVQRQAGPGGAPGPLLDARVGGYVLAGRALYETRIDVSLDGRLVQEETYRDLRPGAVLSPALFDPAAVPPASRYWEADDGATWETLPTAPYAGKRDDIVFVSPTTGWYGTGAGDLFRTADGGGSWALVHHSPGTFVRALGFLDDQVGFVGTIGVGYYDGVTDATPLYRTDDGGETWAPVDLGGSRIAGVCAIDVLRTARVYQGRLVPRTVVHAAGRVGGPAALVRSSDGGTSWTDVPLPPGVGMVLDVHFLSETTGMLFASTGRDAATTEGLVLRTEDGGATWTEAYRSGRAAELVWKASFPTPDVGYATVMSYDPDRSTQLVIKTVDGGRTWAEVPVVDDARARPFGIGFADAAHGWVGTAVGGFETTDGGASWRPAPLAPAANKLRLVPSAEGPTLYSVGTEVQRLRLGR